MEANHIPQDTSDEPQDWEPGVWVGNLVTKETTRISEPDYLISPEGYTGFRTIDLARLALQEGRDGVVWLKPFTPPAESPFLIEANKPTRLSYAQGGVVIDIDGREVLVNDEARHLQNQSFEALKCLVNNENKVVTRAQILEAGWGPWYSSDRLVDLHITYIRKQLGKYRSLIQTRRGFGYMWRDIDPSAEQNT